MTEKEIIRKAITLIKRGWIKGEAARNSAGNLVAATNSEATCWCMSGAINATGAERHERNKIYAKINAVTGLESVPKFNDNPNTTKQDVLEVLERVASGD